MDVNAKNVKNSIYKMAQKEKILLFLYLNIQRETFFFFNYCIVFCTL